MMSIPSGGLFTAASMAAAVTVLHGCRSPQAQAPVEASPPVAVEAAPRDRASATREDWESEAASLRDAAPEIQARENAIMLEAEKIGSGNLPEGHWAREWAGRYYVGDGLGMNVALLVAPEAGISYSWHGCLGLYDGNYGSVVGSFDLDGDGKADGIDVEWKLRRVTGYGFHSTRLYFVRWDGPAGGKGRRYLVPESEMLKLVNDYNEGSYARDALYSAPRKLEEVDGRPVFHGQREPVVGAPRLPEKWAKMLRHQPLTAVVKEVSAATTGKVTAGFDATRATLTIDKGIRDGVYVGMTIDFSEGSWTGRLTIDALTEGSASGGLVIFHDPLTLPRLPAVGETFTVGATQELAGAR